MNIVQDIKVLAVAASLSSLAFAESTGSELTVDVLGIGKLEGVVMMSLERRADGEVSRVSGARVPATATQVSYRFDDLEDGVYSVSLFHDANDNGELDSNMLGIPQEAYGASNNPRVMRRPTFEETQFDVSSDTRIEIKL